jgi:hypothetical protein
MDSNAIFSDMFSELKTAFATSMVRVKSGLYEFNAMKTRIEKDGLLDEVSGRMDPETVGIRCLLADLPDAKISKTILVNGEAHTIEGINKDAAGVTVVYELRKARVVQ